VPRTYFITMMILWALTVIGGGSPLPWDEVYTICFDGNPLDHKSSSFVDCIEHIAHLKRPLPPLLQIGLIASAARCKAGYSVALPGFRAHHPECTGACYKHGPLDYESIESYIGAGYTCRSPSACLPREKGAACPLFWTPCAPTVDLLADLDCIAVRAVLSASEWYEWD
jgi:hypothetical protein